MIKSLFAICFLITTVIYSQSLIEKYSGNEDLLIEKLVKLALENNSQIKANEGRVGVANENYSQAKLSWFNNVNISYQYVPSYSTGPDNTAPKFGLGLSINLGNILSTPSRIAQTENEIKIAEADLKNNKHFIRAETIRRYSNYRVSVELLKVRDQAVNDSESSMLLTKHRFEKGETNLDEYNRILRSYTDNKERRTESIGSILFNKASLEEIIGVSLEEIN